MVFGFIRSVIDIWLRLDCIRVLLLSQLIQRPEKGDKDTYEYTSLLHNIGNERKRVVSRIVALGTSSSDMYVGAVIGEKAVMDKIEIESNESFW